MAGGRSSREGEARASASGSQVIDADFVVIRGPLPSVHDPDQKASTQETKALPPPWEELTMGKGYRHPLEPGPIVGLFGYGCAALALLIIGLWIWGALFAPPLVVNAR